MHIASSLGLAILTPALILLNGGCSGLAGSSEDNVDQTGKNPLMELTGRVVDEADIIDRETEAILVKKLEKLEIETGPQFIIVTAKSLNGEEIHDYSLNLGRSWGIGHSMRDDGVILLVAPNDRKVRIEVGYGLEGSLSDPFCAEVIRNDILPAFRRNEMQNGILAGADRLIEKMKKSPTINLNDNQPVDNKKAEKAS